MKTRGWSTLGFSIADCDLSSHQESREGRGSCSKEARAAGRVHEEAGTSRAERRLLWEILTGHSNMSRRVPRLMWNFKSEIKVRRKWKVITVETVCRSCTIISAFIVQYQAVILFHLNRNDLNKCIAWYSINSCSLCGGSSAWLQPTLHKGGTRCVNNHLSWTKRSHTGKGWWMNGALLERCTWSEFRLTMFKCTSSTVNTKFSTMKQKKSTWSSCTETNKDGHLLYC